MALIKLYKLNEIYEVQHFLQGGLTGKDVSGGVEGLVGKTVTFGKPVFSWTFVQGADPDFTRFQEIKSQLENASGGALRVLQMGGRILFIEKTPSTGCVLKAGTSGSHAVMRGTVDLSTLTYGGGGTVDTKTLKVSINGGGVQTVTFAAPANAGAIVSQINAVVAGLASLDSGNHLLLTVSTLGTGSSVATTNGTADGNLGLLDNTTVTGVATNDGNTLLGFDSAADSTGKVYDSPFTSPNPTVPYFIQSYSVNETTHVIYTME